MTDARRTLASGPTGDAIFNNDGSVLYATAGNIVTAYSVTSGAAIGSWTIGTKLGGVDITPDGQYLVVAELTPGARHQDDPNNPTAYTQDNNVYRIDLSNGTTQTFTFTLPASPPSNSSPTYPEGFYDTVTLTNGHVLASGNGGVTYDLDLTAGIATPTTIGLNATFSVSTDHSRILTEDVLSSDPLFAFLRDGTQTASFTSGQTNNTRVQAISSSGTLIAQYLQYNLNIYDGSGHFLTNLATQNPRWQPYGAVAGLAFSPDNSSLYVLGDGDGLITQLSTSDWHIISQFKVGDTSSLSHFLSYTEHGYRSGIQVSPDGRYLEVAGDTKLQLIDLQALTPDTVTTYGTQYADTLGATAGHTIVDGLAGADSLSDGGLTGVTLIGGPGGDAFHISVAGTVIVEDDADSGTDTEYTTLSGTTIAAGIEVLAFEPGASGTLNGDARDNILRGNTGNDILSAGAGNDQLDGGAGNDIAVINVARSTATIGVNLDGSLIVTSSEGTDTLTNIETIRFSDQDFATSSLVIRGTSGDDTLIGGPDGELILGMDGNDTLRGMGGNDTLDGGLGLNLLDGGDGYDTAIVHGNRLPYTTVSISDAGDVVVFVPGGAFNYSQSTLRNIEAVQFLDQTVAIGVLAQVGTAGNDVLTATADLQALGGLGGNDTLDGGTFTVSMYGGDGDDILMGGATSSFLYGGAGNDIVISAPGAQTLNGGDGANIYRGTAANLNGDTISLSANDKLHITDASIDTVSARYFGGDITFTGGSLHLSAAGHIVVTADPNGGIDIVSSTKPVQNDLDRGGLSDILWRNTAGQFGDWLATGGGNFTVNPTLQSNTEPLYRTVPASNVPPTNAADWKIAGTGDFDGDGTADVMFRHDSGTLNYWSGSAVSGNFTPTQFLQNVTNDWKIAGIADFDGDGRSDLLWRNDNGTVGAWGAQDPGYFRVSASLYNVTNDWKIAGTGDFDGDGKSDILWRNMATGQVGDWLSNGRDANYTDNLTGTIKMTFTPNATLAGAPLNWHIAETGDFNGDGRSDILWRSDAGQVGVWLADSSGNFTPNATLYSVTGDWKIVDVGDYNGDNKDDILWRNTNSGLVGDWLSGGDGSFTPNANLYAAPLDWTVAGDHPFLI